MSEEFVDFYGTKKCSDCGDIFEGYEQCPLCDSEVVEEYTDDDVDAKVASLQAMWDMKNGQKIEFNFCASLNSPFLCDLRKAAEKFVADNPGIGRVLPVTRYKRDWNPWVEVIVHARADRVIDVFSSLALEVALEKVTDTLDHVFLGDSFTSTTCYWVDSDRDEIEVSFDMQYYHGI